MAGFDVHVTEWERFEETPILLPQVFQFRFEFFRREVQVESEVLDFRALRAIAPRSGSGATVVRFPGLVAAGTTVDN